MLSPRSQVRGWARCQQEEWAERGGGSAQAPHPIHLGSPRFRHTAAWPPHRCHPRRTPPQGCSSPALQPEKGGAGPRARPLIPLGIPPHTHTHTPTGANFPVGAWIGEGGSKQVGARKMGLVGGGAWHTGVRTGTTHQDRTPRQQHLGSRGARRRAGPGADTARRHRPASPGGTGSPAHQSRLHSHPARHRAGPGVGSGRSCKTAAPPHSLGWHSLEWGGQAGSGHWQSPREAPRPPETPELPAHKSQLLGTGVAASESEVTRVSYAPKD